MYVKPQPGRSVPDPERGGLLAADGREVDDTSTYWHRRAEDGDVTIVEDGTPAADSASTTQQPAPTPRGARSGN